MGIELYGQTENSDARYIAKRALTSIELYIKDVTDRSLSKSQRLQANSKAQELINAIIISLNEELSLEELEVIIQILSVINRELCKSLENLNHDLIECERAVRVIKNYFYKED